MGVLAAVLALLLACACSCLTTRGAVRAAFVRPSAESLSGCLTTCGRLNFSYPFGIGPARCFLNTDFELICNKTGPEPRLFLSDGVTEVLENIDPAIPGGFRAFPPPVVASVNPDKHEYHISLKSLGRPFTVSGAVEIRGCDFAVYKQNNRSNYVPLERCAFIYCSHSCLDSIEWDGDLQFKFVRDIGVQGGKAKHPNPSPTWDTISITPTFAYVQWAIRDQQPKCAACVSEHSDCTTDAVVSSGYRCWCDDWYQGNPYVAGGCSADNEYNPIPCKQSCGTINIEFPFGLQAGCYARKEFQLSCTDVDEHPVLKMEENDIDSFKVTHININKGLIGISRTSEQGGGLQSSRWHKVSSSKNVDYYSWVIANLTCEQASHDKSRFACIDTQSDCVNVNLTDNYIIGYRCQCNTGFHGNPYLPNGCKDINECETMPGICRGKMCHNIEGGYYCTRLTSLQVGLIIGFCACFGVLLLGLSATAVIYTWRRDAKKKLRRKYFQKNQGRLLEQLISTDETASDNTKVFSLEELEKATNGFDSTRILGRGGHGMVYKGILSDQRVVAIKKPNTIEESKINQFINEVAILSQINHRNIVKLFGCCLETEVPLLVYDFIPNGSLSEVLHSSTDSNFHLSWDHCLRIATEAAGALSYLHSAASIPVFHRDVKSSNILLNANYTAKISDFGISRLVTLDQTHVSTCVQGTFGYLDPDYFRTGQLNEKSDVYSFRVVLLELLLKKEPIFTSHSGSKQSLSSYFIEEFNKRPIREIVSAQVSEEATEEEINSVASLAEMCLRIRGEERPTMKEVEMALQTMRKERLKSYGAVPKNLLYSRDQDNIDQSLVYSHGQVSQSCYSLEQEFLLSAELPR